MFPINPMLLTDFYKVFHYEQYPEDTTLIFSNFTPRKSLIHGINHSVFFGLPVVLQRLNRDFKAFFEGHSTFDFVQHYKDFMKESTGIDREWKHIDDLRKLGYLPVAIHALPNGTKVPCKVPAMVIYNTHPDFYWVTNFLETYLSCLLWGMCTSATIAGEYRETLDCYAHITSDIPEFVDYQAHDFSFRGMYGLEAAICSGMAHLHYFKGTDTIPAILANNYYNQRSYSCGSSVPATEHSVMSAGGKHEEFETFERLITEVYPNGIVSIVSDTWDLWKVVDEYLPLLKDKIMARDGKVVIRPDSGDPVEIICGSNIGAKKGLIERLWDIFGGTINSKGYKQLDPHIGAIYGDSITLERCDEICDNLQVKGFASTNIVFGIGSYSYQYNTRDTFGWAMKATYCEIGGKGYPITKDPITDNGTKKSHSGLLKVVMVMINDHIGSHYEVRENVSWDEFNADDNKLKLCYLDGEIKNESMDKQAV